MNRTQAALAAGFSPITARNPGAKIETPEVCEAIESLERTLLETIPTKLLARRFREALDATLVKTAQHKGKIKDVKKFPDHRTRMEAALHIAMISGRYTPKTATEHTGRDGGPIELTAYTDDQIEERARRLEQELGIGHPTSPDGRALPPAEGVPETG